MDNQYKLESAIWHEVAHEDNAFQAEQCCCYGYDVYRDLVVNASWIEYLYLLISGTKATHLQAKLLEKVSIALANPGIRDLSVRAAMNAGVGKAPAASVLIAALSAGSGQMSGGRELSLVMELWKKNIDQPSLDLNIPQADEQGIWPELDHSPGFEPHANSTASIVHSSLNSLCFSQELRYLNWLKVSLTTLEHHAQSPISMMAVFAAAFCDLGLTAQQSEYLLLILRLPGAAAHAMEQEQLGWRKFPFFQDTVALESAPKNKGTPNIEKLVEGYINEPK